MILIITLFFNVKLLNYIIYSKYDKNRQTMVFIAHLKAYIKGESVTVNYLKIIILKLHFHLDYLNEIKFWDISSIHIYLSVG